jgi:membrane protease YdiL (CAAX protease family)
MAEVRAESPLTKLSRRQVWLILAGFPALYWINGLMPWTMGLFVRQEHDHLVWFYVSTCILHWTSFIVVVVLVKRSGGAMEDIGLRFGPAGWLTLTIVVFAAGAVWIWLRSMWGAAETPVEGWQIMYPWTPLERWLFVFVAFSAGVCEETVYRGFGIRALQARGVRTWKAVVLATLSFVLIHGLFGVIAFPFLFVAGLLYAGLFLWRRSLTLGIYVHALFDVMAVAAV